VVSVVDLEETFVYDSITHAYNMAPSNYRNRRHAEGIVGMLAGNTDIGPAEYHLSQEGFVRDWGVEETANMLFRESQTDMATFQPVPMYAFHDGLVANEKAAEAVDRWPERFRAYAAVDPLRDGWEETLEDQADAFDPLGVKLYPSHWGEDHYEGWSMSDPEVAFPVFEKAVDMGIERIDIHKAIPFGPVPRSDYHPGDVDVAAESFPDIDFSIVHAGVAFAEETAWQLARFPNVYANLEGLFPLLVANERRFANVLAELLSLTGELGVEKLFYSSGAMSVHPRPQLEAFADFQFPEEVRETMAGTSEIPRLTDEHKRKILGENYAEFIGLDIDAARSRLENDEFTREREGLAAPYSTTAAADEVVG
jgi:predicted TIM-barrel fold metal-dependent hydrolase